MGKVIQHKPFADNNGGKKQGVEKFKAELETLQDFVQYMSTALNAQHLAFQSRVEDGAIHKLADQQLDMKIHDEIIQGKKELAEFLITQGWTTAGTGNPGGNQGKKKE